MKADKAVVAACHALAKHLQSAVTVVQAGAATAVGRTLFHSPLDTHPRLALTLVQELLNALQAAVARNGTAAGSVGDDEVLQAVCGALANAGKSHAARTLAPLVSKVLTGLAAAACRPAHGRAQGCGPDHTVRSCPATPPPTAAARETAQAAALGALEVWLVHVPLPGEGPGDRHDESLHLDSLQSLVPELAAALPVALAAARLALRAAHRSSALYAARALELWLLAHGAELPGQAEHAVEVTGSAAAGEAQPVQERLEVSAHDSAESFDPPKESLVAAFPTTAGTGTHIEAAGQKTEHSDEEGAATQHTQQQPNAETKAVPPLQLPAQGGTLPAAAATGSGTSTDQQPPPPLIPAAAPLASACSALAAQATSLQTLVGACQHRVPPAATATSVTALPWQIKVAVDKVPADVLWKGSWQGGVVDGILTVLCRVLVSVAAHGLETQQPTNIVPWLTDVVSACCAGHLALLPSTLTALRCALVSLSRLACPKQGAACARLLLSVQRLQGGRGLAS